ncbi:MAG: 3-oxoacyl-[acyl-carrier-protein] reductase [Gemmatimonadetes bacterium]|nr:3-oxoacyl-[acyl-carrier-protein] reductase [Gemmatimonadota bacterium]MYG20908.1 3-oxoacyl-[acyl-carrier-protein] reductase [Gemmatimonadota bacterium]MYJ38272.1 3-oxoacyl-[acyl-carrier-protein] reductase [Gemmatimonadota bacterium]
MTETRELEGGVAIVTGGSRGIGLAVSAALARAGAAVAIVARDAERAAGAVTGLPGDGNAAYSCDVADPVACKKTVAAVESAQGPVSILVNNAGITRDNILLRLRDDDWADVIRTNLGGAFNMIRAVARRMMKRRAGSIVNITSVVGLMGNAGQANYAASKAGLHGLTKSVAKELASRNIRCNAVAPGFITTDMTAGLADSVVEDLRERIPLARLGEPEDVAGVVRFLAGPEARYITGQILTVDGGMAM